jgi:transcriptional regulator with XRE-family HTH domain
MDLRIKEIMSERNVTSAWLAEKVGISKVAVSNIVTGKSSPSLDNLLKIADALNVSITTLIGEDKEEEEEENVIVCPHCGGKIHFDGEPRMPDHENIQGKEYYK